MKPSKVGQVVKFHTPFADEDPNQLYVILEIKGDDATTRVDIKALQIGHSFSSISTVMLSDLIVVELPTNELIGHNVTIIKSDNSRTRGMVTKVKDDMIILDLSKGKNGVKTNVMLTILDNAGVEQEGMLLVS
jgi:hypothetical protein